MNSLIICDIDGVVCDSSIRINRYTDYSALERGDYNAFRVSMRAYNTASLEDDIPIQSGIDLLNSLRNFYNPDRVVFLTSRGNESRANTLNWLRDNVDFNLRDEDLIMRPEYVESEPGVFWRDGEQKFCHLAFKGSVARELLRGFNILMALDDHLPLCEMYQGLGIPAVCVKFPGVDCLTGIGMATASSSI
jgi:hypothetical protein